MASSLSETDGAGTHSGSILKSRSIPQPIDLAREMGVAQRTHGIGPFRQLRQIAGLALGRARMTPLEYYAYALFRPGLTSADRRAYVFAGAQRALNLRLSPSHLRGLHGLMSDKLLCALVLDQAGFPTPPTLALFSTGTAAPALRCFSTPQALADWLLREAPLPVFGKPLDGSLGIGAASILAAEGDDLILGDGRRVSAAALMEEIARDYGSGWQVQPLLRLHPEVAEIAGIAVAMLRVVTLREADGPRALYAYLRLPAKGAMIDTNQPQGPSGHVVVELDTGALGRAQSKWETNAKALAISTATGVSLAGRRLPFVAEARVLCEAAHHLFPQHGILGFDVALTAEGPVIGEINSLPHHTSWQQAADRGLMNPDFAPRIAAAIAETDRRLARLAAEEARLAGKAPLRRGGR